MKKEINLWRFKIIKEVDPINNRRMIQLHNDIPYMSYDECIKYCIM